MDRPLFEYFLLDHQSPSEVLAMARRGCDTAIESLSLDGKFAQLAAFGDLIGAVAAGEAASRPKQSELQKFGRDLFGFLFQASLRDLYMRLPQGPITLQILSNRPQLKQVPWEYLLTPDRQPAPHRDRSIVRIQQTVGIDYSGATTLGKTLRVLVVSADPANYQGVSWEEVSSTIERALSAGMPAEASIKVVAGASRRELVQTIARERFDVFHFIGHGLVNAKGVGGLVLENLDTRLSDFVSGTEIATALAGKNVSLAILSACQTSAGKHSDDFDSVATSLITAGIPAVVANQYPIPYKSLAPFVGSIYTSLIVDGDIAHAVAEGRVALAVMLDQKSDAATIEWGLPTLHRLPNARPLFQRAS